MQIQIQELDKHSHLSAIESMYPCDLKSIQSCHPIQSTSSYYGYITEGDLTIEFKTGTKYRLQSETFFALPGPLTFNGAGNGFVIERYGYRCLPVCGGPLESSGRLCYIDNCSSSILVSPARLGDPVLNHLSFPANIHQSMHIHPSTRIGYVQNGTGFCNISPTERVPLKSGMVFLIPERVPHSFTSLEGGLQIIAFHPDSDLGPTDDQHPMKSRTYLRY